MCLGDLYMQKRMKGIIFAGLLGIALPAMLIKAAQSTLKQKEDPVNETGQTTQSEVTVETTVASADYSIPVLLKDGKISYMEIECYISGVVLAEMPADFEKEALKAQAVVARTYALKRFSGAEKHPSNAICTDPSCCQAYCSEEDYLQSGGTQISVDKVKKAVLDTKGKVLTYNSQLIDATYFSCSGGKTEDARAVWGSDVPYLQSVDSPGEENASHYMDTVYFTRQEFADCLQIDSALVQGQWIGNITYTKGGGVENITVCDRVYSGTQIRGLLGLRSTAFVITAVGNTVTVTTKGFGHRVGMSQYGADAMAVSGSSYDQILAYYYKGTVLADFVI